MSLSPEITDQVGKDVVVIEDFLKYHKHKDGRLLKTIDHLSLRCKEGEFTGILGPSGCGKSTLLNCIAGILDHYKEDSGTLRVHAKNQQERARVGYVFQEDRLLNWRTARQNIEFVLQVNGAPKNEWKSTIDSQLALVHLEQFINYYPLQLSGGMRQRLAIARALSIDPELLLMDEPFSHLDEITAQKLREELVKVWQITGKSIIFVTHDLREAIYLCDVIHFCTPRPLKLRFSKRIEFARPRNVTDLEFIKMEADLFKKFSEYESEQTSLEN